MSTILIVQHAGCEPAGTIADALEPRAANIRVVRTDLGDEVPLNVEDIDGLVIMGGSMAVYEQDVYPFLTREIDLIKAAVARNVPILGICLGGQLVSAALGGNVGKGEKKEIGWHPIYITADGLKDPLFRNLQSYAASGNTAFHGFSWHGDYFSLPHGAVRLAYSDLCECHAIRYGANVYALQFHPEIGPETVDIWLSEFEDDFRESGLDRAIVLRDTAAYADHQRLAAVDITDRWLDIVESAKNKVPL